MQKKVFEIIPVPKPRQTQRDRFKPSNATLRYRAYADELRLQAGRWTLPESFAVVFHVPMPKSWSKKKRAEMEGKPMQSRPDLSNLLKALEDALMEKDEMIYQATAKKLWSVEGKVEVMAIENVLFQFPDRRKVDQKNIQPKLDRRKRSQKVIAK